MLYDIEFFQYDNADQIKIVRRHSGEFNDLDAAKAYGLANTGFAGTPEEAHGFQVSENGTIKSRILVRLPDRPKVPHLKGLKFGI